VLRINLFHPVSRFGPIRTGKRLRLIVR
jgi:hypothetical protein